MRWLSGPLLLAFAMQSGAAVLSVGTVSTAPGKSVSLSVILQTQGALISGLQFDLSFNQTALGIALAAGVAATEASKQLSANGLATGTRVVIVGLNQSLIADGSVVDLTITAAGGAALGTYPLTLSNLSATDVSGHVIALTAGSGGVSVASPVSQTISFSALSPQALGTAPFPVPATASSGLPVGIASATPAVCTVSGFSVTLVSAGTCSITASQAGYGVFAPATPVSQSFTVVATPACSYAVDPTAASVAAGGGSGALRVLTGPSCQWTPVSGAAWITIASASSGAGPDTVAYVAAPNTTGSSRTGTITVSGQTYTITQFAGACSFALGVSGIDVPPAGGSAALSVSSSGASCSYTSSTSDAANVSVTPPSGTAPAQVTVTVAANPGATARGLTATIGGQTLNINQAGKNCTVTLGSAAATAPAAGGPGSVSVTTQAGCSYTTVSGPSWVTVTAGGAGTGPGGSLFYTVDPNSTTNSRSGALTIGGQSFPITQQGLACSVTLDTTGLGSPFASSGGTGTIGIVTNSQSCSWTVVSSASWATIAGAASGTGTGSVSINAGSTNAARETELNIDGHTVSLAQSGPTCTYSLRSAVGRMPAAGGAGSVGVVTAPGCAWTAASNNSDWLTVTSGASSSGSADVQFSAQANGSASPQTGTLTIAGLTYTLTEAGAQCAYSLNLASASIPATGLASGSVSFTTTAAGCAPNAVSYSSWLTAATSFSGTTGTISWSASANPSGAARAGVIKLSDQTFTVTEAAAACFYTLNSRGALFGQAGGSGNIVVTASGAGCTPSFAIGSGNGVTPGAVSGPVSNVYTQPYTVAAFRSASNAVRLVRITAGGQNYTVKQTSW